MKTMYSVPAEGVEVQVNGCSDSLLWYAHCDGDVFAVDFFEVDSKGTILKYWVQTGGKFSTRNWIHADDASILED